jgi:hypothetical protein
MTNMNSTQRKFWYGQILVKQGGEFCVMCCRNINNLALDGESPKLCIDHRDNNNNHNGIDNMQFLCKSCNTKKNHPQTTVPFERIATPEMAAGKRYESDFRRWVAGLFMENEDVGLSHSMLINSGAEKVNCSTETIKRYLAKMTSSEGIYDWLDKYGSVVLVLKEQYKN